MRMTDEQFKQELFDRCKKAEAARKKRRKITLTVCVCLCFVGLISVFALNNVKISNASAEKNSPELLNGGAEYGGKNDASSQASAVEESAQLPVFYSELDLPQGNVNDDVLELENNKSPDISEFDEDTLSRENLSMIIECTVTSLRVRHYEYDVYSDKFTTDGVLHNTENTVVYEVKVEKTWYGDAVSGEKIVIEDMSYFTDVDSSLAEEPVLSLREGRRYVLPLYECGDSIYTGDNYAGGDITRESNLSIVYPYHPQIEVTNDGQYLVSDDWKTLTAENAKDVVMDALEDESYYSDKMRLVDSDTFAKQMKALISKM